MLSSRSLSRSVCLASAIDVSRQHGQLQGDEQRVHSAVCGSLRQDPAAVLQAEARSATGAAGLRRQQ